MINKSLEEMTVEEVSVQYVNITRNMSSDEITAVETNNRTIVSQSSLLTRARVVYERWLELRDPSTSAVRA